MNLSGAWIDERHFSGVFDQFWRLNSSWLSSRSIAPESIPMCGLVFIGTTSGQVHFFEFTPNIGKKHLYKSSHFWKWLFNLDSLLTTCGEVTAESWLEHYLSQIRVCKLSKVVTHLRLWHKNKFHFCLPAEKTIVMLLQWWMKADIQNSLLALKTKTLRLRERETRRSAVTDHSCQIICPI